jgi:hypothetical protein
MGMRINDTRTPREKVIAMIRQNKRKGGDRSFVKGYILGRFCTQMDVQEIIDLFMVEWPKSKLKLSAQDFIFLRDNKIEVFESGHARGTTPDTRD